jgi:uncharacterized protein (DUF427 family)
MQIKSRHFSERRMIASPARHQRRAREGTPVAPRPTALEDSPASFDISVADLADASLAYAGKSGLSDGVQSGKAQLMQQTAATKPVRIPGPDHPITIAPHPMRVVISVAGRTIADTQEALALREANYPAVLYIPRKDVDMALLERTDHSTYCPYKGDCVYFSIPLGGARAKNAVWTYEAPYASVMPIKDHLAFYPDRVDAIEERPRG